MSPDHSRHPSRAWSAGLGGLLLAIFLLTFSGRFHSIDEISIFATAESLVREQTIVVEQLRWTEHWRPLQNREGAAGLYLPKRGAGPALPLVPLLALAYQFPGVGLVQMTMLAGALMAAACGMVFALLLFRMGYDRRVVLPLTLTFAVATPLWPYSRTVYDLLATMLLWLLALYFLLPGRRLTDLVAGTMLALSLLMKLSNVAGVAPFILYLLLRRREQGTVRSLVTVMVPVALMMGLLAAINQRLYGSPLASGYGDEVSSFVFDYARSLPALLVSPGKGILIFAPPLLAALAGLRLFWQRHRAESVLAAALLAGHLLLYGAWAMWGGGWSWGPRFLIPIVPFLLLPAAPLLARGGRAAWSLLLGSAGVGVLVNLPGAVVDFNLFLIELSSIGEGDGDTVWRLNRWPPAHHVRLLLDGQADLLWLSSGTRWLPIFLALAAAGALWLLWRRPRTGRVALVGPLALAAVLVTLVRLPTPPEEVPLAGISALIQANAGPRDGVILDLVPYYDYFTTVQLWMERYRAAPPYTGLIRGRSPDSHYERWASRERLWLVMPRTPPGDPASSTEAWWAQRGAFLDERWVGDFRVVRLAPLPPPAAPEPVAAHRFEAGIELLPPRLLRRDGLLLVSLPWRATAPVDREFRVFVQLLGADGQLVAAQDHPPRSGFAPTSGWVPGTIVWDHYALPLPADGGGARLIAGLYDPESGGRLMVEGGGDAADLGPPPGP